MLISIVQLIEDGIEEVVRLYRGMMQALTYRILQNYQSAEDAVQEAMLNLSQNMAKLDNIYSKRSFNYIYTVTQNAALGILRKESGQSISYFCEEDEIINIHGKQDIDAFANQYSFSSRVCEALEKLSPLDRDILCYRYGACYTPGEIAELIGENRDFVYKRLQCAKAKLAAVLTERGDET